jgi:hypothetical protein
VANKNSAVAGEPSKKRAWLGIASFIISILAGVYIAIILLVNFIPIINLPPINDFYPYLLLNCVIPIEISLVLLG